MNKNFIFLLSLMITILLKGNFLAQEVLFDFDNVPIYSSLPIDVTVGGITAHLSAASPGYSIQDANVLGFTPPGFAGHIIYPNSLNLCDLHISYNKVLTDFSILYSPNELGCDNSATMRVTAFMNGTFVVTSTKTATFPGTWPVDTLRCSFQQGFDSIVIHYDSPPPTCQDYGTIFMADNMRVTTISTSVLSDVELPKTYSLMQNYPNPFNPSTTISYALPKTAKVELIVFNLLGQEIARLVNQEKSPGNYKVDFTASNLPSGVYIYKMKAGKYVETKKMILLK